MYIGYPSERTADDTYYDFDFFTTELAEHEGMSVDIATPRDTEDADKMPNRVLFQEFVDILPKIAEANSISEELKKVVVIQKSSLTSLLNVPKIICHDSERSTSRSTYAYVSDVLYCMII